MKAAGPSQRPRFARVGRLETTGVAEAASPKWEFRNNPTKAPAMNEDVKALKQALQSNLELVQLLSRRIELLEQPIEDNAARQIACMLMLRALFQSSANQPQTAQYLERMTDQMHAQPGVLVDVGKSTFQRVKSHLNWMTEPGRDLG